MTIITVLPHDTLAPNGASFDAPEGETLCDALLRQGIAIEHACEKSCACTTCHIIVREGFNSLDEQEEKEDDFGSDVPGYSWKMKSRLLEIPDMSASLVSRDSGADQTILTIMKMFTEHLSKSIKEVNIAVVYLEKKKPITADVTIYMIDYDRPLPVPGAPSQ